MWFKDGPSDLEQKFYRNTKKSPLYSQSLLIFIHKTPVVENHRITREIKELLRPRLTPTGITVYFCMNRSPIYILEIHRKKFLASDEDIMEKITCLIYFGI